MEVINIDVTQPRTGVNLGKQGENRARCIAFDVSSYMVLWPNAKVSLLVKPAIGSAYPVSMALSNGIATWTVTNSDTVYSGNGQCELHIVDGNTLKKSITFSTFVEKSLGVASGEAPEPIDDWIKQAEKTLGEVEQVVTDVEKGLNVFDEVTTTATRVTPLNDSKLVNGIHIVSAVGVPEYVSDVSEYEAYGLTETGWYVFSRINAPKDVTVSDDTATVGADGIIANVGDDYIDVAVRFPVAAVSVTVTVVWNEDTTESFVFNAPDLAIRNLDYRTTFYVYDAEPYVTWEYAFTTDATFVAANRYYTLNEDGKYELAEVTAGEAVPAYYTADEVEEGADATYTQCAGGQTFASNVTYYTKGTNGYAEADVTVGDEIPAYYKHTKITFEGLARNITYRLDTPIDCPMEFILPDIEDETHGAWFEIRCRHLGAYSMTLTPPSSDVKIATEHTQKETAGMNNIDLHYMYVDGVKLWRFLNTHSSIPA